MAAGNASLVRSAVAEIFVRGRTEVVAEFFSTTYVAHVTGHDVAGGHALIQATAERYRQAFRDLHVEVDVLVDAGETVAWRRTMRAIHAGAYKGFPATGLPLVWQDLVVSRIAASRIAEEWIVTDLAERLLLSRKSLRKPARATGGARVRR